MKKLKLIVLIIVAGGGLGCATTANNNLENTQDFHYPYGLPYYLAPSPSFLRF